MNKKLEFGNEARRLVAEGVQKLADAVTSTLGPNGRNVLIEQEMGNPVSTKDGVTVAKAISFKDRYRNAGAQIVKQAAIKTADKAGDGTTTSTLLAKEIFLQGMSVLDTSNAVEIKRGIDEAVKDVTTYLAQNAKTISGESELEQVATISANNDGEVGSLISLAMSKVGQDGVITVEESKTGETYLETVEGMQFQRGFKSPFFVTDTANMTTVLNDPYILITDKKLTVIKDLLPILESVSTQSKSLLIIADDVDGEALSTLVVNKVRGILNVVAVRAPEFGDRKKFVLEDIAVLTGGQVITADKGMRLDKFDPAWLGRARKVTVDKDSTTIVEGGGSEEAMLNRVSDIKTQIDNSTSPFEREQLQDRLGRLAGGVAVVHVGGQTEVEMKEKKDRVEDALHATRAALEEGILPGGGVALVRASDYLRSRLENNEVVFENKDRIKGYQIVEEAIQAPFRKILENAGESDSYILRRMNSILTEENWWTGYNPRTEAYEDFSKSGILDPTKVTRLALQNAASVAGTLLTTECVIVQEDEDQNKQNQNLEMGF
jgi:chaperonin GroEL